MVFEYIALTNQVAIRRTMAEIKKLNSGKDDLAKDGIYFHIDPEHYNRSKNMSERVDTRFILVHNGHSGLEEKWTSDIDCVRIYY